MTTISSGQPAQNVPNVILNDQTTIPQLGFGVYQVSADDCYRVVSQALQVGYRHIDTAAFYKNEAEVGRAIRESGIPREEIYLTTKVWNTDHGYQETKDAFAASLDRLGLDYVDLYLIHWPQPAVGKFVETFEAMGELKTTSQLRSIGVSNFTEPHLRTLIRESGLLPCINQIELHPGFSQADMRQANRELSVRTEAWSPLGRGRNLDAAPLSSLAEKFGKTVSQIILRWHLQMGNVVIPKTTHLDRMEENFDVFDFWLDDEDIEAIIAMDSPDGRMSKHPDDFNGDI